MTLPNLILLAVHALIVYAWALFPLLLLLAPRRRRSAPPTADSLPPVAFVLSAYNEESHIAARVRNLLEMEYPAGRWTAFIGVDGAKDGTAVEARDAAAGDARIHVLNFEENRGKVAVLKDLVQRIRASAPECGILVFSDANTEFEPSALRALVAPFSDPTVGGVCGKLAFVKPKGGKTEENVYWKLENWLKTRESGVDSCLGANGAIYAIRASLFWNGIPSNTIIDDFVIGMKVREQGYRMVYEPDAVAVEELPAEVSHEWKRRVRIGAGDYQAIRLCRRCLGPSFGAFAWAFWSHKVLRWFTPHLMILGLPIAATGAFSHQPLPGLLTLAAYAGASTAALGGRLGNDFFGRMAKLLRGIDYLLAMQVALFAGFLRFCRGNLEGRWQRSAR